MTSLCKVRTEKSETSEASRKIKFKSKTKRKQGATQQSEEHGLQKRR
jgi:hypothetical protein